MCDVDPGNVLEDAEDDSINSPEWKIYLGDVTPSRNERLTGLLKITFDLKLDFSLQGVLLDVVAPDSALASYLQSRTAMAAPCSQARLIDFELPAAEATGYAKSISCGTHAIP
jgi:hypothetical protein